MLPFLPQDQVFWYLNKRTAPPLTHNITTDVVVIGGGMAGLSAAQSFAKKGLRVVLIEKNYCGSGATGKSSGFITPNSELGLNDIIHKYGAQQAQQIWKFITTGSKLIQQNILNYNINCDYQIQDTVVIANTMRAFTNELTTEYIAREQLGYTSTLYSEKTYQQIIASHFYKGALAYGDSFAIQAYRYCIGMQQILQEMGVQIFEETPAIALQDHIVTTPNATIRAEHIIVCTDHFTDAFASFKHKVYHAQTFIMLSAPLSDTQIKNIFPHHPCMVWDTELIYNYYRLTGDNRLILGGASLLDTYATQEHVHNTRVMQKLTHYFNQQFPTVRPQFEYMWPGLIGISKDLFPIAGHDQQMNSVYYITAATGLPWAAALGNYSAERIVENNTTLDEFLSPYRSFLFGDITQQLLGTRLTFALSNFLTTNSL